MDVLSYDASFQSSIFCEGCYIKITYRVIHPIKVYYRRVQLIYYISMYYISNGKKQITFLMEHGISE